MTSSRSSTPASPASASPANPLDGQGESFSDDGRRLSKKLLGDLPDFRLGRCSMHLQPNSLVPPPVRSRHHLRRRSRSARTRPSCARHGSSPTMRSKGSTTTSRRSPTPGSRRTSRTRPSSNSASRGRRVPFYEQGPVYEERVPGRGLHQLVRAADAGARRMRSSAVPALPLAQRVRRPGDAVEPRALGYLRPGRSRHRLGALASAGVHGRMRGDHPRGGRNDGLRLPSHGRCAPGVPIGAVHQHRLPR